MNGIREATREDMGSLAELLAFLFEQEKEFCPDADLQVKALEHMVMNDGAGNILVFELDDEVVGMVSLLYSMSTALGAQVAVLEDMVVHPLHRGKGIGSTLLREAIAFAERKDCKRITLLTDSDNGIAHSLYEKEGFSSSSMVVFRKLI